MRVDLHTHTFPASSCSEIDHESYVRRCREAGFGAIALTNHGSIADNLVLERPLADAGIVLVHGVEISTLFGDFIIYSPDLDYLGGLRDIQGLPRHGEIPDTAAIVWVHPVAGGGRSGSSFYSGLADEVGPVIDGVEVCNGNWTGGRYVETAREIATRFDLAATGGSDAHRADRIGRCLTEVAGVVASTSGVVGAIKDRATMAVAPVRPAGLFGRLLGR